MKNKFTQIKNYCLMASLSALVITAKAQTVFPGSVDVIGGFSTYNVSLFVTNDHVGTMLMTAPQGSSAPSGSFGLNDGGGFLQHDNGPFWYVDSNITELGNQATAQRFLVNSGGAMDMIDASGSGFHLNGYGQAFNDNILTVAGGPSSYNVSLVVSNDGVATMLLTAPQSGSPVAGSFGLNNGGGFLQHDNGPFWYVDSNITEFGNQATAQRFLVNSGGGLDMIDASGTGLHLDGSGHLINDNSFQSDAGTFYSDGSGNITATSVATTGNNTVPATSVIVPYSTTTSPFVWANTTTQNLVVYVDGLQGSVSYNGAPLFSSVNYAPVTVMLQPGASVSIVNTVTVTNAVALRWHQF